MFTRVYTERTIFMKPAVCGRRAKNSNYLCTERLSKRVCTADLKLYTLSNFYISLCTQSAERTLLERQAVKCIFSIFTMLQLVVLVNN